MIGGSAIKLRIEQDCTEEEMAVISAAIGAYHGSRMDEGAVEERSGWRFSGRAHWHGLPFHDRHSLRNSDIPTWRRVALSRYG